MRVPDFGYKAVLDETPPRKMIAFIAPNRDTKKKPWQLVVSVDEVEEATGLDFFGTMEKTEQERLESAWDFRKWFGGDCGMQGTRPNGETAHVRLDDGERG